MLLSICIPNYNRGKYLNNCLNSILIAKSFSSLKFEICISDNGSKEDISSIINFYKKKKLVINFKKNSKNLGFGANFNKVVKMAKGEFIWMIGNDDLLYTKSKFSVNNIDTYEPEEQPVSWKNNDPDCIPFKCVSYDSVNQDYTIDGEIVNIVFTNDFENFINDGIEFKRQAEDIFWNNF